MLLFSPLLTCDFFNAFSQMSDIWKYVKQITCVFCSYEVEMLKRWASIQRKISKTSLVQTRCRKKKGQDTKGLQNTYEPSEALTGVFVAYGERMPVLFMCALKCISRFFCLKGLSLQRICWQKEFWYRLFWGWFSDGLLCFPLVLPPHALPVFPFHQFCWCSAIPDPPPHHQVLHEWCLDQR